MNPINDPDERDRHIAPLSDAAPVLSEDDIDETTPVTEQADGSALVDLAADTPAAGSEDFYENLVGVFDDVLLGNLARDLLDNVDRDKQARSKRDEQYAEGIRRTGLGNEAPGGANFDGASKAVHPALIEGCIDFAARAIKELFPAEGPVKTRVLGEQTKQKLQKADRKRQYMNWQLTTQIEEYRREFEVMLTQLPLGGSQYLKCYYDPRWERTRVEFVAIDDLLLPFEATSLRTAQRVTHTQRITKATFLERVDSGMYVDIAGSGDALMTPERTESAKAAAVVEGTDDLAYNDDGLRIVYETQIILSLPKGTDPLAERPLMPYVLTVDENSGKPLSLRRNWDEKDNDKAKALQWIVEFPFIPWRGAYAIGLSHIIGSMAGAATGALRALLDSAHINNMPGALKLAGAKIAGQNIDISPTQIAEIEAGPGVDDVRKLAMPLPFNPPSNVLFTLLEWLTNQAKGVVATAEERIGDATNNMPVGTALALIEQGSITFSSIHARLHAAQKEMLAILHRLNAKHLTDREVVEDLGELVVSRADFQGPMDIEPVSDPNIFSDAQRYAQLQAVMQLAVAAPPLYKMAQLHKRALRLLKFPNPDEVLAVPEDAEERDAISENTAATDPLKTLKAYDGQDHLNHLRVHVAFMSSPVLCANPFMANPALPALVAHCKEHLVSYYKEHAFAATEASLAVNRAQGSVAGAEADAVSISDQEMMKELAPLLPALMHAVQAAQQFAPQPAQDPQMAAVQQRAQAETQRNALDSQRFTLEQQRFQFEQAQGAQTNGLAQLQTQLEKFRDDNDRNFEAWQTKLEMGVAQRNADMAAMQGAAQRAQDTAAQAQAEIAANERHQLTEQVRLTLGLLQTMSAQQASRAEAEEETRTAVKTQIADQGQIKEALSAMLQTVQELLAQRGQMPKLKFTRNPDTGDLDFVEPMH